MDTSVLQLHSVLESVSPERISEQASIKIAPHRLRASGRARHSIGYLRHVSLRNVCLSNLCFGSEAVVEGPAPESYYYIQLVQKGTLTLESNGRTVTVDSKSAAVINPFHKVNLFHSEDCSKIIVRIHREAMERELINLCGRSVGAPIEFSTSVSIEDPRVASLIRVINHVCQEVDDPYSGYRTPQFANHMEGLLSASVLAGVPNSYSGEINRLGDTEGPAYLRRAERYIETHLAEEISLDDLVCASGASMRTLYKAFNTYRHLTPMGYVKRIRLECARRELEGRGTSHKTVADVAMAVGMSHLGNFAADYRRLYGELPSETRKKTTYM